MSSWQCSLSCVFFYECFVKTVLQPFALNQAFIFAAVQSTHWNRVTQSKLKHIVVKFLTLHRLLSEVELRTQTSRSRPRAKNKLRGQGQPFRGQTRSRPRTGMLEAKDQGHRRKCSQKEKKKIFRNFVQAISKRGKQKRSFQFFRKVSGVLQQNFNDSKKSALLELRTGQFSRNWGFEAKDFKMFLWGRSWGHHLWLLFLVISSGASESATNCRCKGSFTHCLGFLWTHCNGCR